MLLIRGNPACSCNLAVPTPTHRPARLLAPAADGCGHCSADIERHSGQADRHSDCQYHPGHGRQEVGARRQVQGWGAPPLPAAASCCCFCRCFCRPALQDFKEAERAVPLAPGYLFLSVSSRLVLSSLLLGV